MFVDICFPHNDEVRFVQIAQELKLFGLLLVYPDRKSMQNAKIHETKSKVLKGMIEKKEGFLLSVKIENLQRPLLIFNPDEKINLTQVHLKEVAARNVPFVLPLRSIYIRGVSGIINRYSLLFSLCIKYKIDTVFATCAQTPFELRGEKELFALAKAFSENEHQVKSATGKLYGFAFSSLSTSFL